MSWNKLYFRKVGALTLVGGYGCAWCLESRATYLRVMVSRANSNSTEFKRVLALW